MCRFLLGANLNMAYKFSRGIYKHSGSLTAEEGAQVDRGGLTVSAGTSAVQAITATTMSASSTIQAAGDITAPAFHGALDAASVRTHISVSDTTELDFSYSGGAISADLKAGSIANSKLTNSAVSVAGKSVSLGGSILLNTADVSEDASNKYFTDARARAAISVTDNGGDGALSYDSATGVISYTGPSASEVRAHLSAGNGLSFAGGQFAVTSSIAGAGLAWDAGVLSVDTAEIAAGLSGSVRAAVADFVEGSDFVTFDDSTGTIGVDATKFSGSFSAALATKSTSDLAEGTNKYFTAARARAAVSIVDAGGDGSLAYDSGSGVFTYTGPSAAEARAHFSAVDAGGDGSFSYADGVFTYTGPSPTEVRAHLSAGDFVTYASGSGLISVNAASFTGSARSVVSAGPSGGLAYNAANGRFSLDAYAAGDGLSLVATGSLKVNVDASTIEINSDALRVKDLGITNAKIADTTIANIKLVNKSVSVVAGNALTGGGTMDLGGSVTLDVAVNSDALEIVGDAVALKSTIGGARTFSGNVTVSGDLTVNGTTTYLNTNELVVKDSLVTIASGSSVFAANHGIELGSYASLKTVVDGDVGNALSSSLPMVMPSIKAGAFYGSFVGSTVLSIESKGVDAVISRNVTKATANITLTLPSAPVTGQEHRVKCVVADASSPSVRIEPQAGATIDGDSFIVLESYGAGVSLVWDGSAWMVF